MVRQYHQVTAAVAITLALTAGLASTASADSNTASALAYSPALCGDVCSGHGYNAVPTPVHVAGPNAASTASPTALCGDVCSGHGYGSVTSQPTSVRATSGDGFNWGDAGIGAGACVVLLGIGLAGTRTLAKGRQRRLAEQRTIATS